MSKAGLARRMHGQVGASASPLRPKLADADSFALTPGPAAMLQRELSAALASDDPPWSQRRTLAFIILTCGGFWAAVAIGAGVVLR